MATDLEIMIHAKTYLDKLANGINPLTDEALEETDVVNQVRISRCLFYTADVLRQLIERGGLTRIPSSKTPKAARIPFALSKEQIDRFQFFEQPIFITAFTERINSLHEKNMKRLRRRSILTFLEQEGYIFEAIDSIGRVKRKPTKQGFDLGLSTVDKSGKDGDYTVILYNKNAQQYILDHLDQIAEINMSREKRYTNPEPTQQVDPETGEIL